VDDSHPSPVHEVADQKVRQAQCNTDVSRERPLRGVAARFEFRQYAVRVLVVRNHVEISAGKTLRARQLQEHL